MVMGLEACLSLWGLVSAGSKDQDSPFITGRRTLPMMLHVPVQLSLGESLPACLPCIVSRDARRQEPWG